MKRLAFWMLAVGQFWLAPAFSQELVAPDGSTKDSRARDMWQCLSKAEGKSSSSYSVLGVWDDLKQHVLKDRNTGGYVHTTKLSNRSTPVANDDGHPVRRESLFASADALSDRYVLCLLARGYRWKDSAKDYFEEVRELALSGVVAAQAELGLLYLSPGQRIDHNEFASWTRKAAEKDYAIAQFNLANAYRNGDGVERNDEEALRWMVMAAQKGYARARPILNRQDTMKAQLRAIREDTQKLEQDQVAAEKGDVKAQFKLAARYEDGRGLNRDMKMAIEWYRKAADGGHLEAQGYLGVIYDKGRGTKQDEMEAARWYRKAAEQGHAQSQLNLGIFYFYGHGVEKNKAEALKWLERAKTSGHPGADRAMKELL